MLGSLAVDAREDVDGSVGLVGKSDDADAEGGQESKKKRVISVADAVVDEGAVVVEASDAAATDGAVSGSDGDGNAALGAKRDRAAVSEYLVGRGKREVGKEEKMGGMGEEEEKCGKHH